MKTRIIASLLIVVALVWAGCATMFNGTTQYVEFDAPKGTAVFDTSGASLPLVARPKNGRLRDYLKLRRDRDYLLVVRNGKYTERVWAERELSGGWIALDIMMYAAPAIVDAVTGAWYNFRDLHALQETDSLLPVPEHPLVSEQQEADGFWDPVGGVLVASTGFSFPIGNRFLDFFFFNQYTLGLGYAVSAHTTIMGEAYGAALLGVLPRGTRFESMATHQTYALGARYYPSERLFACGGMGWSHVSTDSISRNLSRLPSQSGSPSTYPGIDVRMPSVYVGFGLSGAVGYLEVRHTFGLSRIELPEGERGRFGVSSLSFGLNLNF